MPFNLGYTLLSFVLYCQYLKPLAKDCDPSYAKWRLWAENEVTYDNLY